MEEVVSRPSPKHPTDPAVEWHLVVSFDLDVATNLTDEDRELFRSNSVIPIRAASKIAQYHRVANQETENLGAARAVHRSLKRFFDQHIQSATCNLLCEEALDQLLHEVQRTIQTTGDPALGATTHVSVASWWDWRCFLREADDPQSGWTLAKRQPDPTVGWPSLEDCQRFVESQTGRGSSYGLRGRSRSLRNTRSGTSASGSADGAQPAVYYAQIWHYHRSGSRSVPSTTLPGTSSTPQRSGTSVPTDYTFWQS